ncbi:tetratricopeptide repeat protein, partial [bacterium]|nr:tetratricopeptide repeat protein [bacterium]
LYAESSPTAWQVVNSYMNRFPDDSTVVDRVLEVLQRAIRSDRKNASLLRIYANYTLKAGMLEESMTATIEADPLIKGGGMLVLQAAQAMLRENAVDLARRGFQQVLDWEPPSNTGLAEQAELGLGQCYEALEQYEEAKASYYQFIENHPQSNEQEEARYRVANILLNHERNAAEALTMFKGIWIRGRGSQKVIAGIRIGDCHAWLGEFDQAISAWSEVVTLSRREITEESAEALLRIARANLWRDSTDAALAALDSVMNGNTINNAFNDAVQYSAMIGEGGFYRAVRAFAEGDYALFRQENTEAAEKFSIAAGMLKYGQMAEWSRLQQAKALRQSHQPEAAIAVLDTFITNHPESVNLDKAKFTKAVIRADDLGDLQGALDQLNQFLIEHPRSIYLEQVRRKARILSNAVS